MTKASDQAFYPDEFERLTTVEELRAELRRLHSECDALRAETIEECAKVADAEAISRRGSAGQAVARAIVERDLEASVHYHRNATKNTTAAQSAERIAACIRALSAPQAQGGDG